MFFVKWFVIFVLRALSGQQYEYAFENLAPRHQLSVYTRQKSKPRLKMRDRLFWVAISKLWPGAGWKESLVIVQPETVIRWHHRSFKLFWRWKSRKKLGRPRIALEIRELIRKMSRENARWGVPRIKSELALLGYDVAESTIAKYMAKHPKPPSQTWRIFLKNHARDIVACDFFTIHTVTFRVFYVFVMLRHSDRKILYFNVTQNPTMEWTFQQIREAFAFGEIPKYRCMITARYSRKTFKRSWPGWKSKACEQPIAARGRIRMWSALLEPSAGNAWTT